MAQIYKYEDLIDSRDVIARIEELEADEDRDEEDTEWLRILKKLADDGESLSDWTWGVTLIRDSYFEEYAQGLAEDIGAISRDAQWPLGCIDWEQAARELRVDYTNIDFDGVTYWAR